MTSPRRSWSIARPVPFLLALLSFFGVLTAKADAQRRPSALHGFVLTDSTEHPLRGAEVTIPRLRMSVLTDSLGGFRLAGIQAGHEVVIVHRAGFVTVTTQLTFTAGDTLETDFLMVPNAQPLAGVRVSAKNTPRRFAEFERRRAAGFGHFITEEALLKMQSRLVSEVLSTLPGPHIYRSNSSTAAWVASSRGQQSISGVFQVDQFDRSRGAPGNQCYAAVFLDGSPVFTAQRGQQLFDINTISTAEIAGIEYYGGGGTMPPEFNGSRNTCGALVIWTK